MPKGYLSDNDYQLVTSLVPIICVDILPVRRNNEGDWEVGLIVRATGSQAGKLTILGGRIYHSEKIDEAIHRHLQTDLQIESFTYHKGVSESVPFMVQQYSQADSSDSDIYGFDPTKHALALTYLVEINETPQPVNEAAEFTWVNNPSDKDFGFNQQLVVKRALDRLSSH